MTGPSSRVLVLLVLVWLGGLLLATCVGLLAVRLVAAQVGDPAGDPLSAAAAAAGATASQATSSPPVEVRPTDPPPPTPSTSRPAPAPATPLSVDSAATARTFTTPAGTLGVQCAGTDLRLLYATPAPGYALDERSVAGTQAEVRFEGGGTRVRVRLSCATGAPQLVEQRTDPDDGDDDEPDDGGDDD